MQQPTSRYGKASQSLFKQRWWYGLPSRSERIRIGVPMNPMILAETEAYDELPEAPSVFDPHGDWEYTYRIFGARGFYAAPNSFNVNLGYLSISRENLTDNEFELNILKHSVEEKGNEHVLKTRIICKKDVLATPLIWETDNFFYDYYGQERRIPGYPEKGSLKRGMIHINKRKKIKAGSKVTSDWSLFEAVQRLDILTLPIQPFDVLYELSLLRPEHRLYHHGRFIYELKNRRREFDVIHEMGSGMLPYEYYLESSGFLTALFSFNVIYFHDPDAKEIFNQRMETERRWTQEYYEKIKLGG